MRFLSALIGFASSVIAGELAVLSSSNFTTETQGFSEPWFIKFYAPWCPHCKRMAADWQEFAVQSDDIHVGEVDATVEKTLKRKFGVKHFPTLLFFKDGNMYEYQGQRTVKGFKDFVETNHNYATKKPIPGASDD